MFDIRENVTFEVALPFLCDIISSRPVLEISGLIFCRWTN